MSIIRFFSLSLLLLLSIGSGMAKTEKAVNGAERQIGGLNVRIEFYSPSIVRVTKPVVNGPEAKKSYSVIMQPETLKDVKESKAGDEVTLSSPCIRVTLNTNNGKITFAAKKNERLLTDTTTTFDKRTDKANEGQYKIRQTWLLDKDEAIYGLGQLRDTHMNQRGRHVEIWNHNTYTSIPYFTSEKGYGVYWDNAGKSYFDDNEAGTSFTSETGTAADYYFIYKDGTQDGVIAGIRTLTGKATMFPLVDDGLLAEPRAL